MRPRHVACLLVLLGIALVATLPPASAHVCGTASSPGGSAYGETDGSGNVSGGTGGGEDWRDRCGPCVEGEDHAHGEARGEVSGGSTDGCVSSRHFVPGPGAAFALVALVAVALRRL